MLLSPSVNPPLGALIPKMMAGTNITFGRDQREDQSSKSKPLLGQYEIIEADSARISAMPSMPAIATVNPLGMHVPTVDSNSCLLVVGWN